MLNKGLRDNESIRIDNVLKTLRALDFVTQPLTDGEKFEIENLLKEFALNIESLVDYNNEELINLLVRCHLDFNHLEQFADFLMAFSKVENYDFEDNALAIYQYIQKENVIFSFGINTKIASAKNK
ncbi:hypothetical protein GON26_05090 [Flavobacterium sp. GA093]|uniref:Uncharacterized protein n=1 Tax=Flavobacterium hydrocarbonoxydans TaxID=2683249 RepID=A0A6I4NMC4_9FLAO|nr:hypothetical protein [Flavobacterium hydrocarbonoxydans]MWB93725.1 hypothetical protein [Flavobacterium hydrocarbonoxydans]